jgi:hypothetical protein
VLLPMLDPDLLVANRADQHQALVEIDVVCARSLAAKAALQARS